MDKIKIYSPRQVAVASFLGGPIAAVYMLAKNYGNLGEQVKKENSIMWGSLFTGLLILALPFIPEKFPHVVLPIAYTVMFRMIVEKHQMTKEAVQNSPEYDFQPNWNVFYASLVGIIVFLVVAFLWIIAFQLIDKSILHR